MERPPLHNDNPIYTLADLKPKFITGLQNYFRKVKLKWYKKKKVNQSKTSHNRLYHMKFKVHIEDDINPQLGKTTYEMVVPATAVFFAKILLERSVKNKIEIEVVDWEEMDDEDIDKFEESKQEYQEKLDDI